MYSIDSIVVDLFMRTYGNRGKEKINELWPVGSDITELRVCLHGGKHNLRGSSVPAYHLWLLLAQLASTAGRTCRFLQPKTHTSKAWCRHVKGWPTSKLREAALQSKSGLEISTSDIPTYHDRLAASDNICVEPPV